MSKNQSQGKRKGRGKREAGKETVRTEVTHFSFISLCVHAHMCMQMDMHAYLHAYVQGPEVNLRIIPQALLGFFLGGGLFLVR